MMEGVTIRRADNGWIVVSEEAELAFQDPTEDENGEAESLHDALWAVLDELGANGDGFASKRVFIDIRPGDEVSETLEVSGGDGGPVTVVGHSASVRDVVKVLEAAGFEVKR